MQTSRIDSRNPRSDEVTYKLDSLTELGGLNTCAMLVSFQKVNRLRSTVPKTCASKWSMPATCAT